MRNVIRGWVYTTVSAVLLGTVARAEEAQSKSDSEPKVAVPEKSGRVTEGPAPREVKPPAEGWKAVAPPLTATPGPCPTAPCPEAVGHYGGFGVLFLCPYVSHNTAFTITNPAPTPTGAIPLAVGSVVDVPFDWGTGVGWQAWAGWTHVGGWGCRLGVFCFSNDSSTQTLTNAVAGPLTTVPGIIPPIPGAAGFGAPTAVLSAAGLGADQLAFRSDLDIQAYDLEATSTWADAAGLVRVSGGLRFQRLDQGYQAALINPGDGVTTETQRLDSSRDFFGVGPTVGVFFRQNLWGTQLAGYGSVRGSIVFGQLERTATFAQDINDPALAALVGTQRTRTRFDSEMDHVLTVGEIELGVEYGMAMGGSRGFVRAGFVGQAYGNAGSATGQTGTLGLVGGVLAFGVDY
jgi:hypothetical protein